MSIISYPIGSTPGVKRSGPGLFVPAPGVRKAYGGTARRGASPKRRKQFTTRTVGPLAVDVKFFDTQIEDQVINRSQADWSATTLDPSPALCLFTPENGNGFNERIGRKAWLKKLFLRCELHIQDGGTAIPVGRSVRILLVQDMQTNGTQMTGNLALETPAASTAGLVHCAPQNLANLGRFRILKDKTFVLQNMNGSSAGAKAGLKKSFKFSYKPLSPIEVNFNQGSGGTIADIVDNSFHILAHDSAESAFFPIHLTYYSRATFTG